MSELPTSYLGRIAAVLGGAARSILSLSVATTCRRGALWSGYLPSAKRSGDELVPRQCVIMEPKIRGEGCIRLRHWLVLRLRGK